MGWKPGQSGNPMGRPAGSRNKASLAVDELLEGDAEAITKKAIELAKAGDSTALRLCLERIAPVRKDRPVPFDLPVIENAADGAAAGAAIMRAVAGGDLTPSEASELMKIVESFSRVIETAELEKRLAKLEQAGQLKGQRAA